MSLRRIVLAIPCLLRGGTEMQTLQLVRVLVQNGNNHLTVVCYFEFDENVVKEFKDSGAAVRLLDLDRTSGPLSIVRRLRNEFRSLTPDLVHVQYMAPGLLPIISARLAGCRAVLATVHQPWISTHHGVKARWMLRLAARLCNKFACVSEAAERSWFGSSSLFAPSFEARQHPSARVRHCTIHNAVDLDRLDAALKQSPVEQVRISERWQDQFIIGAVSRLRHEKGIDVLLNAFASVAIKVPCARLVVVGEGPDADNLKAQARQLGISPLVCWLGKQPWERAMQLLNGMDLVVVPSHFEGFGLAAAEAMACRKPIIASNIEALAEVIGSSGAGLLVPAGEATGLTEAIFELWRSPRRRTDMAIAGRRRVESAFSYTIFAQRTCNLYESLLSTKCHAPLNLPASSSGEPNNAK